MAINIYVWTQFVITGPISPRQRICKEWVGKLGFSEFGLQLSQVQGRFEWNCRNKWEKILNLRSFIFISIDLFYMQLLIRLFSFFSRIPPPPLHKGFFTLYTPLWIILTLHLLFIWDSIWVSIPSNTSFGPLWVVITRVLLFRCLLHVNAARKVVTVYLMWWQQLFLRSFVLSSLLF